MKRLVYCGAVALLACGGGKGTTRDDNVGDTHVTDGDVPFAGQGSGDSGTTVEATPDAGPPPAPVTFEIKNTGSEDLSFNMNKGWQPVIFAWSGERGKSAKPIIMFEKFCTASCDSAEDAICPYCPPPENNKAARENQKYEHVAAGASLAVPWDGQAFVYEKAKGTQDGKKARCECYRKDDPPPEEYTVWACGLRLTDEAGVRTKPQCIEQKMTLPPAETPMVVTFEFPDPEPAKKSKKKRR
jgi:hypothetical protein